MNRLILIACAVFCFTAPAFSDPLQDTIVHKLHNSLPHASVSILVTHANSAQKILTYRANKMLYPASNIKLFTAAAAYYFWPKEQRFFTTLSEKDNNVYLYFGGSPSFEAKDIDKLFTLFKTQNKNTIIGNLIIDTSRFKPPYYNQGTSYDDLGWYYSAPNTAVMINENTESYILRTGEKPGSKVTLEPKEKTHYLTLINELKTVSIKESKQCGLNLEMSNNNSIRLFGCVVASKVAQEIKLAIPNPKLLAQKIVSESLKKQQITLNGQLQSGIMPKGAKEKITLSSPPLTTLINHMLHESDNLYAETLARQLAYANGLKATTKESAFAIKKILRQHTLLDMKQLQLEDGVGTRYNLTTAEQIVLLLNTIYHDKSLYPLFLHNLPQSAVSGSLKDRFKKTELAKRVFAKTGTMHDVCSLSGYLLTKDGQVFTFSILINGINEPIDKVRAIEDELLEIIAAYIDEHYSSEPAFA